MNPGRSDVKVRFPSTTLSEAGCPRGREQRALRANIAETLSPVLITEQGENGNQSEHESEAEWICLGQPAASSPPPARPNPEVVADARRRTFSLDYKLGILKKAEALKATGGIAALLRREGLYSSHLTTWRQEREAGMRQGLTPKSRGPKQKPDSHKEELQKLQREILRLTDALARAEMIIDVQKKVGSLLGWALPPGQEGRI